MPNVPQKLREKRITECVELRKAHKNESFLKRRNITLSSLPDEDALSPEFKSKEPVSPKISKFSQTTSALNLAVIFFLQVTSLTIEDIIKDVTSVCRESQTRGCQAAR